MPSLWSAKEKALAAGLVLLAAGAPLSAAVGQLGAPDMDIYMYDNAFNRATRGDAATFGAPPVGNEDRLGQYAMGWETSSNITPGLGLASYQITRVTLKVNQIETDLIQYDPTYDSYKNYLPSNDPNYVPDTDAGHPLELYGLGLRGGFTNLAVTGPISATHYGEGSPFGLPRNAFAYSPSAPGDGDVSDNVSGGFETTPFAIGMNSDLAPGDYIPGDTLFTFELNLADPGVLAYMQAALHKGELGFVLSSLHPTEFTGAGGEGGFPRYSTREAVLSFLRPSLEIEYLIVPEPSTGHVLILGAALLASLRAWRRRHHYS